LTYLGTRPILPDELEQYELHHRARIAIKPGITGMWQVSGRSDIHNELGWLPNIIEKEQNKFDLIFKVKRKYENTNESTTWVSINERTRWSHLQCH
jgi:lipopolysaccharide/colanic/teichoic acid biosynthesis glycosyltransferase